MALPIIFLTITSKPTLKHLASLGGLLVLGIGLYLYLPVRSAHFPIADWDHPTTLKTMMDHMVATKYRLYLSSMRLDDYLANLWRPMRLLINQLPLGIAPFGLLGFLLPRNRVGKTRAIFITIISFNLLSVALYGIPDVESYYLPSIFLSVVGLVVLLLWIADRIKPAKATIISLLLLVGLLVLSIAWNCPKCNQSENRLAYIYASNIMRSVPHNFNLISTGDNSTGPLYYLHHIERKRQDLSIYDPVIAVTHLRSGLKLSPDNDELSGVELCRELVSAASEKTCHVKEHLGWIGNPFVGYEHDATPYGMVYRWDDQSDRTNLWDNLDIPDFDQLSKSIDLKGLLMLVNLHLSCGQDLEYEGNRSAALIHYLEASRISRHIKLSAVHNNLGIFFADRKMTDLAERAYQRALNALNTESSDKISAYVNMGNLVRSRGQFEQALDYYQKALNIDKNSISAHYNLRLAEAYRCILIDSYKQAIKNFRQASLFPKADPKLDFNIGRIYDEYLNDTARAIAHYKHFLQLAPQHLDAEKSKQRLAELIR